MLLHDCTINVAFRQSLHLSWESLCFLEMSFCAYNIPHFAPAEPVSNQGQWPKTEIDIRKRIVSSDEVVSLPVLSSSESCC